MARILVIDDRPINRQFLTVLLGYQNHELREASDGVEGLRVAHEQRPDLIISDVLMPTMDGYEFVRHLRADPEISKTPVIFSTAHYLGRESHALAEKCGVTSIIYKPCEPETVLAIVAAALNGPTKPEPPTAVQPEEFDREHQQLLTNKLADKTDQLRDAHGKLTALMEFSTDLANERDPAELLDRYCSVAREVIGARWTLVVLLDRKQKTVRHLGIVGLAVDDSPVLRSALLDTGVFKTLMNQRRTICLSDVTSTPAALQLPARLPRASSLLVAPLSIRGEVDGWICLADKLGLDAFSEQDHELTEALAAKMAVAYDNACLYSDSLVYAGKLELEISERKQAADALAESENRLRAVLDAEPECVKLLNANGSLIDMNPAGLRMIEADSVDQVRGQNVSQLAIPEHREAFMAVNRRVFAGESAMLEFQIVGMKGTCRWLEMHATPLRNKDDQIIAALGITRDITERKRTEEARRESETRYRTLFEYAPDGIVISDPEGNYLDANASMCRMLGYSHDELVGLNSSDIVIPAEARHIESALGLLNAKSDYHREWEFLRQDGSQFCGDVIATRMPDGNFLGMIRDTTERKQAEESLRGKNEEVSAMTQQLWQASKLATMGELSASIAHELNNPLATVGLRAEALLMQLPEGSDQRRPLEVIAQEVDRMATLVNNLLQFSRCNHRQISTLDLSEEIATSVEFVHYLLRNRNIEVIREFADGLPSVQADPERLRQLFLNLLTNASDAMPQGGKLKVCARSKGFGDSAVAIDFADSGEGIAAGNLAKVWEPFFTTKPEGKGTGLGLAICRRIVEEHGGTIKIASELGQGTTVSIILPATNAGETPAPVEDGGLKAELLLI